MQLATAAAELGKEHRALDTFIKDDYVVAHDGFDTPVLQQDLTDIAVKVERRAWVRETRAKKARAEWIQQPDGELPSAPKRPAAKRPAAKRPARQENLCQENLCQETHGSSTPKRCLHRKQPHSTIARNPTLIRFHSPEAYQLKPSSQVRNPRSATDMQLLRELRKRPGGACWQGNAILREHLEREQRCKTGHGQRGPCADGKRGASNLRRSGSTPTGLAVGILRRPSTSSVTGFVTRGGSEPPSNPAFLQISGEPPLAPRSVPNSPKQSPSRPASRMPNGGVVRSGSAQLPAVRVGGNALRRSYAEVSIAYSSQTPMRLCNLHNKRISSPHPNHFSSTGARQPWYRCSSCHMEPA